MITAQDPIRSLVVDHEIHHTTDTTAQSISELFGFHFGRSRTLHTTNTTHEHQSQDRHQVQEQQEQERSISFFPTSHSLRRPSSGSSVDSDLSTLSGLTPSMGSPQLDLLNDHLSSSSTLSSPSLTHKDSYSHHLPTPTSTDLFDPSQHTHPLQFDSFRFPKPSTLHAPSLYPNHHHPPSVLEEPPQLNISTDLNPSGPIHRDHHYLHPDDAIRALPRSRAPKRQRSRSEGDLLHKLLSQASFDPALRQTLSDNLGVQQMAAMALSNKTPVQFHPEHHFQFPPNDQISAFDAHHRMFPTSSVILDDLHHTLLQQIESPSHDPLFYQPPACDRRRRAVSAAIAPHPLPSSPPPPPPLSTTSHTTNLDQRFDSPSDLQPHFNKSLPFEHPLLSSLDHHHHHFDTTNNQSSLYDPLSNPNHHGPPKIILSDDFSRGSSHGLPAEEATFSNQHHPNRSSISSIPDLLPHFALHRSSSSSASSGSSDRSSGGTEMEIDDPVMSIQDNIYISSSPSSSLMSMTAKHDLQSHFLPFDSPPMTATTSFLPQSSNPLHPTHSFNTGISHDERFSLHVHTSENDLQQEDDERRSQTRSTHALFRSDQQHHQLFDTPSTSFLPFSYPSSSSSSLLQDSGHGAVAEGDSNEAIFNFYSNSSFDNHHPSSSNTAWNNGQDLSNVNIFRQSDLDQTSPSPQPPPPVPPVHDTNHQHQQLTNTGNIGGRYRRIAPGTRTCPECNATFTRNDRLKYHVDSKHKKLPPTLNCTITNCNKSFRQKSDLVRHMRSVHRDRS